jgi:hypothetical protein
LKFLPVGWCPGGSPPAGTSFDHPEKTPAAIRLPDMDFFTTSGYYHQAPDKARFLTT